MLANPVATMKKITVRWISWPLLLMGLQIIIVLLIWNPLMSFQLYPYAELSVCGWKLGRYPQLQGKISVHSLVKIVRSWTSLSYILASKTVLTLDSQLLLLPKICITDEILSYLLCKKPFLTSSWIALQPLWRAIVPLSSQGWRSSTCVGPIPFWSYLMKIKRRWRLSALRNGTQIPWRSFYLRGCANKS